METMEMETTVTRYVPKSSQLGGSRTDGTPDIEGFFKRFALRGRDPAVADENLYRYCENDPTDATDPSGMAAQDRRDRDEVNDHLTYDWAGKQMLDWWLTGGGEKRELINQQNWTDYMEADKLLANQISAELTKEATQLARDHDCAVGKIDLKLPNIVIENGESIVGYQYLHGVNPYFEITGNYKVCHTNHQAGVGDAIVHFTKLRFAWLDRMDPNEKYDTDTIKSLFGKAISLGQAKDYDIVIAWDVKSLTLRSWETGSWTKDPPQQWPYKVTLSPPEQTQLILQVLTQPGPPLLPPSGGGGGGFF